MGEKLKAKSKVKTSGLVTDCSEERRCNKDIACAKECNRDLISEKIVLLQEQGQGGLSVRFCTELREL